MVATFGDALPDLIDDPAIEKEVPALRVEIKDYKRWPAISLRSACRTALYLRARIKRYEEQHVLSYGTLPAELPSHVQLRHAIYKELKSGLRRLAATRIQCVFRGQRVRRVLYGVWSATA